MYGVRIKKTKQTNKRWFDSDLTAVDSSRRADLTLPYYFYASLNDNNELDNWNVNKFMTGYLMVNCG